jgi:hypothetical protein
MRDSPTLSRGQVWSYNGVKLIPFDCDNVPEGAAFAFACDSPELDGHEGHIVRPIHNSTLQSKYAYFKLK